MATIALLVLCAVSLPILVTGECPPNTCRNGGIFEVGYKEKKFRCKCPNSDALTYGPLCELVSIGFHSSEAEVDRNIRTRTIPVLDFHSSKHNLDINFDLIVRCHQTKADCHLLNMITPKDQPLFTAWMHKSDGSQANYRWIIEFTRPTNVTLGPLTRSINTDKRIRMKINVRDRNYKHQVNFDEFNLNELNVEKAPINKTDYNKYASNFCHSTSYKPGECSFDSISTTKCDGSLGSGLECSCSCDVGKLRQLDTLNEKEKCWQNLTKQNECIDDTKIVSTGHTDYELKWGDCRGLSMHDIRIEFMILTRQTNVESLLELNGVFTIKIEKGQLKFVINGRPGIYAFSRTAVSDDFWHKVSINKLPQRFELLVDHKAKIIHLKEEINSSLICEAEIRLSISCIRGFRLSDVAMPVRETDQVNDYSGKPIIQFHKGRSVSVGDHCDFVKTRLTPPTCNPDCQDNEECDGPIFGAPQCFCKNTFVRKRGICVATKSDRNSKYNADGTLKNNSNDRNCMLKYNWMGMISALVTFSVCQLIV